MCLFPRFLLFFLGFCAHLLAESPLNTHLVPASYEKGAGQVFLVITIKDGWKFYAPTDAKDTLSYTPKLQWSKSKNLLKIEETWPKGLSMHIEGLSAHVYRHAVIVPLRIQSVNTTQPVVLNGTLEGLVCSESACQPLNIPLQLTLDRSTVVSDATLQVQRLLKETPKPANKEGISLAAILFIAIIGGVILNIMPCVLPVLGIKLMVFAKSKKGPNGEFPTGDLWMTVGGIFGTFMFFALGTLILKEVGETIGLGIHFQNPYFLSFMVVTLILLTANTWGFFEFAIPSWAQNHTWLNRLHRWKPFFSGILSVLLATPCATPFVGTAVGFALARNALDIFAVFAALAVGFSSPYWLTALLPSHKLPLPKPGPWLDNFQKFLGFLLLGTVGWLVFLMSSQHPWSYLFVILLFITLIFISFWLVKKGHKHFQYVLLASLGFLLCVPLIPQNWWGFVTQESGGENTWQSFEPEKILAAVAQKKTVFVDLTAAWCLTCHMNKQLVLNTKEVTNLLKESDVIRMRGDWTKPNTAISNFLKSFQRAGIPFNAVFGPERPEGVILPEILTIDDVKQAVHLARGKEPHARH